MDSHGNSNQADHLAIKARFGNYLRYCGSNPAVRAIIMMNIIAPNNQSPHCTQPIFCFFFLLLMRLLFSNRQPAYITLINHVND